MNRWSWGAWGSAWACRTAVIFLALSAPATAAARSLLVFGPHPDDESLIAAGRVRSAVTQGDTVKVVVVTNGDIHGVEDGLDREAESVAAASVLGLSEDDVIFLGYGDGSLLELYSQPSGEEVITSSAHQTSTYANRGLGGMDFHRYLYGVSGPYNRNTLLGDIEALLLSYWPDEVYTASNFDSHSDHQVTAFIVADALAGLRRSGAALPTRLYQALVWAPLTDYSGTNWPYVSGFTPWLPFFEPPTLSYSELDWERLQRFPVPPEMRSPFPALNLKHGAISQYRSQPVHWLLSFARLDEPFWVNDFGANMALTAQVTVSSEDANNGRFGIQAVDGNIDGFPWHTSKEWATQGELAGAWIQLDWASPARVEQINLFDRPDPADNVLAGTLTFGDGSSLSVGALPPSGRVLTLPFPPRVVSWARFTVDQAEGSDIGLSEIQVLGQPATTLAEVAPRILWGPVVDPEIIKDSQTSLLTVVASSPDCESLQYLWSAEIGSIEGEGAEAVFVAPEVESDTVIPISVQVVGEQGMSASNVGFVTITRAGTDTFSIEPSIVAAGRSVQGVVALAAVDPEKDTVIPLSSSDPIVAAVPESVTVPAGSGSRGFEIVTLPVLSPTSVTISAHFEARVRTATLMVNRTLSPDNLAPLAAVTVSSENPYTHQLGIKAVDGVVDGYPRDYTKEWATQGQLAGAWIQLDWNKPVTISQVRLFDRPNLTDNVEAGVLLFSDGDSSMLSSLPNDGSGLTVDIPEEEVSWIRFRIDQARGSNIGLAEIQVFGPVTSSLSVDPPSIIAGGTAQGALTLASPAPAGGAVIPLSSGDAMVTVPIIVTVPEGEVTAIFPVSTSAVSAPVAVTLYADCPDGMRTAVLMVVLPTLTKLDVTPSRIIGGAGALGTVELNAAGPQEVAIELASSDPNLVSVPASVTIPAGSARANFAITTFPVGSTLNLTLTATFGSTQTAVLVLDPVPTTRNVARESQVTVSSENPNTGQLGTKAIDGVIDGYPRDYTKEWATRGQRAGAWIELRWSTPVTVVQVRLYERPNLTDNVQAGSLLFSDGSSVAVGKLPNNGSGLELSFPAKTIDRVRFEISQAVGQNIGLAEIEVYGQ